ncbi:MAG: murein biosynthesis integral membrane protein MurJ [Sulfurihydrogenibium sp.]|nr:MAG: murein biosynthesis integral membrane protein MurJ [Sulfurihydrogenibium sp.]PMP77816.1 MAG: murein biosynthesis integral membrane protein MurJ [Sulfurihydrogenibium sp.]
MNFIKNTIIFSFATFISRILGYIRDAVVAYYFGSNQITDAFYVAWRLPNTLRQLVAEGSFNAAFIPIYTQEYQKSPESAKQYAASLFSYYTLVLSVITVFIVIFAEGFVKVIAPGFADKGNLQLTAELVRIVFPYLILIGWTSFFMALLNTKDRFFITGIAPALLNLSFIFSSVFLSAYLGIYALAVGALVGGLLQFLIQLPQSYKEGLLFKPTLKKHPAINTTLKKMLPAFASFGVSQFSFVIDTVLASFLYTGAVTYLYYGNRIFQLPLGLFIIGLGNALLVSLSKHFAEKNFQSFNRDLTLSFKMSLFVSIPAMAGMVFLGKEIVELLLVRGAFTYQDALLTYYALVGYAAGLLGYAFTRPFKSAYFATGDTKTPLISTVVGLLSSMLFAVLFTFVFKWGVFGLALASSLGAYVNFIYLYFHYKYSVDLKSIFVSFLKVLISTVLMVVFIEFIKVLNVSLAVKVFAGVVLGGVLYIAVNFLLKEESTVLLFNMVKRKLSK